MADEYIVRKGLHTIGGNCIINYNQESSTFNVRGLFDENLIKATSNDVVSIGSNTNSSIKLIVNSTVNQYALAVYNSSGDNSTVYGIHSESDSTSATTNIGINATASGSIFTEGVRVTTSDVGSISSATSSIGINTTTLTYGNSCNAYGSYITTSTNGAGSDGYGIYVSAVSPSNVNGGSSYGIYSIASGKISYGAYIDSTASSGYVSYGISVNASGGTNNYAIYAINGTVALNVSSGRTGIGLTSPTANLHIKAGTATASTAPLKLNSGTVLTTPEDGAIEYTNPLLYFTNTDAKRLTVSTDIYSYQSSDITKTNDTVLSSAAGLSIALAASRRYEFEILVIMSATTNFGIKGQNSYTGTLTELTVYSNLFSGTSIVAGTRTTGGTTFASPEFSSTTTTSAMFIMKGMIYTNTAGTLSFQFAQSSSGSPGSVLHKGSYIKCRPIG